MKVWRRVGGRTVTCYGQIDDSGPYVYDDATYVFGANDPRPRSRRARNAGMDVSPALPSSSDGTSRRVRVKLVDVNGNNVVAGAGGIRVFLSSDSATGVFLNRTGARKITSILIRHGRIKARFRYLDTQPGTPTITASAVGVASAQQTESVV